MHIHKWEKEENGWTYICATCGEIDATLSVSARPLLSLVIGEYAAEQKKNWQIGDLIADLEKEKPTLLKLPGVGPKLINKFRNYFNITILKRN